MEKRKTKPCYEQNSTAKFITDEFEINGVKIEIKQHRLDGAQKEFHKENVQSIYTDGEIYKSVIAKNDIEAKLKIAQDEIKKEMQLKKATQKEILEACENVVIDVDAETQHLMYNGTIAIQRANREVKCKFIAYSCENTEFYSGYMKKDGVELNFEESLNVIRSLDEEFIKLYTNANKLTYATAEELEQVKS